MKRTLLLFALCSALVCICLAPAFGQKERSARFKVDFSFQGADGSLPTAALVQDATGTLYGTTASGGSGFGVVFKLSATDKETVLHAFDGADGATPYGALVLDNIGNLYGTTSAGGSFGFGTVFEIDVHGTETVLHSFAGKPDGASPYAGLVIDGSGNLYGTTERGGTSDLGTIFKVDAAAATEVVLHSFGGAPADGADPKAGLTLDPEGNLYGTTFLGGSSGSGTVFEFDTKNTETVLYNFTGSADGGNPAAGLTRASSGIFYGTTTMGGIPLGDRPYGCCKGVLFELSNSSESVLYTFTGGSDGGTPTAALALYNGALYGTTVTGGPAQKGTAFSVTISSGTENLLHGFLGKADGAAPSGGLLVNQAGVIYGTAAGGGRFKQGTVFQYNSTK